MMHVWQKGKREGITVYQLLVDNYELLAYRGGAMDYCAQRN